MKSKIKIPVLSFLIILCGVFIIPITVKLALSNQDIRNQAAQTDPCWLCINKDCYQIANPPFCNNDLNQCKDNNDCQKIISMRTTGIGSFDETIPAPETTPTQIPLHQNIILYLISLFKSLLGI